MQEIFNFIAISGLFIKHFEVVIKNDNIHNLAKDIRILQYTVEKKIPLKNIIHHLNLKYGNFGQNNTIVQPFQLKFTC